MEMLKKSIVMEGCGCNCRCANETETAAVQPSVGGYLNNEMIEAVGLARAYVPVQPYENLLEENRALACGTVFGSLVKPYVKGSALSRNTREVCEYEQRRNA